jgi:hypothetical protein
MGLNCMRIAREHPGGTIDVDKPRMTVADFSDDDPIISISPGAQVTAQDIAQFDARWMGAARLQRLADYDWELKNRRAYIAWGIGDDTSAMVRPVRAHPRSEVPGPFARRRQYRLALSRRQPHRGRLSSRWQPHLHELSAALRGSRARQGGACLGQRHHLYGLRR